MGVFDEVVFDEFTLLDNYNESAGLDLIALFGFCAVAGFKMYLDKRKRKEEDKKNLEKIEKLQAEYNSYNNKKANFDKEAKKAYGIDLVKVESGKFKTDKELFDSMVKDGNQWASKIKSSKLFKENIEMMIADNNGNTTISHYKSVIKISTGVNGYKESIQVINGSQDDCIDLGWVCDDIANMYAFKYSNYLNNVYCGDGDEGHIYYEMKI